MKRIDYAALYTLRADGRYMGYDTSSGKRRPVYDRDPERLWHKLNDERPPEIVTFSDVADRWEAEKVQLVSYKTAESYVAPLRRLKEHFGADDVTEITTPQITAYLKALANRGYGKRSVQLHRDILSMVLSTAILEGVIRVNPCDAAVLPRNLKSTPRELPDDTAIEAVKNGASAPFGLFALVCLYAGLRRGEALALRYEDIDRRAKVIHVTKAVEFIGNTPHIKTPKTAAGCRDVILLDALAAVLPDQAAGYIFPDKKGELMSKTVYRRRWANYCAAIGCEITAHQLRHGFATILYEAGVGDKDAQELLGHANITTTRDVYTHIRQSHRAETASRLNSFLAAAGKTGQKAAD